MELDFIRM